MIINDKNVKETFVGNVKVKHKNVKDFKDVNNNVHVKVKF